MKKLITLVKMQLKEKLNFKRRSLKGTSIFNIAVSILGIVLKFALVTALCAAVLMASNILGLFSLTNTVPATVISIVFSAMLLMSIFSCTVGLTRSMYFSSDNAVLLTLPCRPIEVYLSKLIIFFFFELKRNMSFMVPLFIAYFIVHGHSFIFYPWMLFCFLLVSLFTVAVGALLSIPAMWISTFFRQYRYLQIASIATLVVAAVSALFFAISLIPENIDILGTWGTTYWQIQDFLNAYAAKFPALYSITLLMLGETKNLITTLPPLPTFIRFITLFGITAVLLILGVLIVRPIFYKMASKPFEYLKKWVMPKANISIKREVSPTVNEFRMTLKNSSRMFSNVGILIAIPIMIYLLNKIFLAMNTRELGDQLVVTFNLLIILLVILNANTYASSIFSRDGRSAYLIKVQPTHPMLLILAKLIPNTVFGLLSLIATTAILLMTARLGVGETIVIMVGVTFIYLAHLLYCAETDIMNPQSEIYASTGTHEGNPNETRATVSAFIISFLVSAVMLLLLIEGNGNVHLKMMLVSLFALLYRVYMFFRKVKLYYKEK